MSYTMTLERIAHLMPPDVHRLMEDEAAVSMACTYNHLYNPHQCSVIVNVNAHPSLSIASSC